MAQFMRDRKSLPHGGFTAIHADERVTVLADQKTAEILAWRPTYSDIQLAREILNRDRNSFDIKSSKELFGSGFDFF